MNTNYRIFLVAVLLTGAFLPSCNFQDKETSAHNNIEEVEVKEEVEEPIIKEPFDKEPLVHQFYAWPNKVDSFKTVFKEKFNAEEKHTIWSLNRVDERNSWRPDTLIIPEDVDQDWMAFSPFPAQLEILQPVNKIVVFSYPLQVFAAYENGKLLQWGPTSLGTKRNPTPTGLHFANWKSKESISTVNDNWILPWNFNIQNFAGVGWHEYSLPGYPASHSCLRLLTDHAQWLYQFAEQWVLKDSNTKLAEGTPVIVYGEFPFGEWSPWLNALENSKSVLITVDEMNEIISEHLDKILEKQKEREDYFSIM